MRTAILILVFLCFDAASHAGDVWLVQSSGTTASLRGISAVSDSCCWASGAKGTVLRTIDGGTTWASVGPPMAEAADFRDLHAWDDSTAVIMSAGDVDRLYRTEDGGKTWHVAFEEPRTAAFFDGLTFDESGDSGWLMGDPLDGRVYLLRTVDKGRTWQRHSAEKSPRVATGIAAFAASGTHLLLQSNGELLIGLGGMPERRSDDQSIEAAVLRTSDAGESWNQIRVPMQSNASSGIFSLCEASRGSGRLVAVGGDFQQLENSQSNTAISDDGGIHWKAPTGNRPSGFRSAVVRINSAEDQSVVISTGPNGTDLSKDFGDSWTRISGKGFHTMSVSREGTLWAAGSEGRVARAILP